MFPLYKHPQDALPQRNPPTMPVHCGGIFLRVWGLGGAALNKHFSRVL